MVTNIHSTSDSTGRGISQTFKNEAATGGQNFRRLLRCLYNYCQLIWRLKGELGISQKPVSRPESLSPHYAPAPRKKQNKTKQNKNKNKKNKNKSTQKQNNVGSKEAGIAT